MSRASDYKIEVGEQICEWTAAGGKLSEICDKPWMPSRQTVYAWLARHAEFYESYNRARRARALGRVEKIDELIDMVLARSLDANSAKVIIDAHKWQAAKEDPKMFGDKSRLELTGGGGGPVTTFKVEEPSATLKWLESVLAGEQDKGFKRIAPPTSALEVDGEASEAAE